MKHYHSLIGSIFSALLLLPVTGFSQDREEFKEKDNPGARFKEFYEQRSYPFEAVPEQARLKAMQFVDTKMRSKSSAASLLAAQPQWRPIGPYTVGGRVKSVVVHPTNPQIVYIGSAAGGAWKTTDGGDNWLPIFDNENGIAFGSLAIDPNNPEVLYAATGEASGNIDAYLSSGVFKTLNGGTTWKLMGLTEVGAFSKIFVHPKNSGLVIAGGAKGHPGFYKSIDGGTTWKKTFKESISDITINPANENEFFIGATGKGIYHSTDGGETWSLRSNGLPFTVGRISVQQAATNPDILYTLLEAGAQGAEGEIFKSSDHGAIWVSVYQGGASFFNGQGWYDNYLEINPKNPDIVLAAGIDIFKTKDGGKSWVNTTFSYSGGSTHPDQQHAAFSPSNPTIIYAGNDGGMYKSIDGGTYWDPINNNLAITQFYDMAIDHSQPDLSYGGTQDNGTLGTSTSDWNSIYGGDGFHVAVNHDDPNIIYGEVAGDANSIPWRINRSTGQGGRITNGIPYTTDAAYWSAPLVVNPLDGGNIFHGRHAIYASYDAGDSWETISPTYASPITAIGVSPVTDGIIYTGSQNGEVYATKDGGYDTWVNVSRNGLVNRFVTDISCSPIDANTAYIAFSGYGTPHLFKTTDLGKTWVNISAGLPDVPHNAIALHPQNPNIIFVGTDIGVFATFDGGSTWVPYGTGLPRTPIADLEIHKTKPVLRAATHGRSMWEVDLANEAVATSEITAPTGGEKIIGTGSQDISWYGFTGAVKVEFSPNNGEYWKEIGAGIAGNSLRWQVPNTPTKNARIRITSLTNPSQLKISNTFTVLAREKGSIIQESGVPFIPYGLVYDGKGSLWVTSFQSQFLYRLNAQTLTIEQEIKIPGVDSLCTDLAIDPAKGLLYIHKLNSTSPGAGAIILTLDIQGNLIRQFKSPAPEYGIGLALVDGNLIVGDRDGARRLYTINAETGAIISQVSNPCQQYTGPRGLTYDGSKYIYQIITAFPAGGGNLTNSYAVRIDKSNLAKAVDSINLSTSAGSVINARGVEYDPNEQNLWVTEYDGSIYKISTSVAEIIAGVENSPVAQQSPLQVFVTPNPFSDGSEISFSTVRQANIKLYITDALGKQVAVVFDGVVQAGAMQNIKFESSHLAAGIYTGVFIIDGQERYTQKLVIIK
ncbi:MAG: T9SS type A sorting domain-containing protein [Bacteroidota bacterium]